jgi:hypothetical protein
MADDTVTAPAGGAGPTGRPLGGPGSLRTAPAWVAPLFATAAVVIVPWIVYLAVSLPRTVRVHDRAAWVGFDIGLVLILGVTAYLAWRGRPRVALAAVATSTMLVVDAWFDVLTSRDGLDRVVAVGMSLVELTLAAICLWIAMHATEVVRRRMQALARRHPERQPD